MLSVPQFLPCSAQLVGLQQAPWWHISWSAQSPQRSVPPQPSLIWPQVMPFSAQLVGTQLVHTLFRHVSPAAHTPQFTASPEQACEIEPQFLPCATHSAGGGVGTHLPCWQMLPALQVPPAPPQVSVPP